MNIVTFGISPDTFGREKYGAYVLEIIRLSIFNNYRNLSKLILLYV